MRLSLVKLMLSQPNFLVMDEPTNHLDLLGKEALEKSLSEYDGTMLFVSHDRYFISKLATAILHIDENGAVYTPMNYHDYIEGNKVVEENQVKVSHQEKKSKPVNLNIGKEIAKLEKKDRG